MAVSTTSLPDIKALLEKKATFERGVAALREYLNDSGGRAVEEEAFTRLLARCHALLRSRYNTPAYWNAARDLYLQTAACCPVDALAGRLKGWIEDCQAQLAVSTECEEPTLAGVAPPPYSFQGQLSTAEAPRVEEPAAQELLAALVAAVTTGSNGTETPLSAGTPVELLDEQLLRALEESAAAIPAASAAPPASRAIVERLPRHIVPKPGTDTEFGPETACTICMEELQPGEVVQKLPCGHVLHVPCLAPWLQKHNSCPICRHELPTDDSRYEREKIEAEAQKGAQNAISHAELLYL